MAWEEEENVHISQTPSIPRNVCEHATASVYNILYGGTRKYLLNDASDVRYNRRPGRRVSSLIYRIYIGRVFGVVIVFRLGTRFVIFYGALLKRQNFSVISCCMLICSYTQEVSGMLALCENHYKSTSCANI